MNCFLQIQREGGVSVEFKDLLEQSGMNMRQFSEYFKIPYRTVQDWKNGISRCQPYLQELIEYKLKNENLI